MAYTEQQLKDAARKAAQAGDYAAVEELYAQAKSARNTQIRGRVEEMGPISRAAIGAVTPLVELGTGIAQAQQRAYRAMGVPDKYLRPDTTQQTIEDVRAARSGAGTAGTVGEVATFALPGGAGTKLATRLLPRAGMVAKAGVIGGTEGAGYELARPEVEGTSRLERAATAGALGLGGGVAGPVLGRVGGGVLGKPSQAVMSTLKRAKDVGVRLPLTVAQMLGGRKDLAARGLSGLEEGLTALPFNPIRGGRENALEAWNLAELRQTAKAGNLRPEAIREAGDAGLRRLQVRRDALYQLAIGGKPLPTRAVPLVRARATIGRLTREARDEVATMLRNISDDFASGNMTAERVKLALSQARVKSSNAFKDGDTYVGEAYKAIYDDLWDALTKAIGPQRTAILKQADALHAQMVPLEEAARGVAARRRSGAPGVVTPQQVQGNLLRKAPRGKASTGRVRGQAQNEAAVQTFSHTIPSVGPGTAEKVSAGALTSGLGAALGGFAGTGLGPAAVGAAIAPYGIAALLRSPTVARALTGMTKVQQNQYVQQLIAALRSNTAAGIGAGAGISASQDQPR